MTVLVEYGTRCLYTNFYSVPIVQSASYVKTENFSFSEMLRRELYL